jgi:hypothetical protein
MVRNAHKEDLDSHVTPQEADEKEDEFFRECKPLQTLQDDIKLSRRLVSKLHVYAVCIFRGQWSYL